MDWQPHITVATVIERNNEFLLVEELADGELVFNQPAGHLEPDETLEQAAIRETLEETGWEVQLHGIIGMTLYKSPLNGITYHRTTFFATPLRHHPLRALDNGIHRAVWLSHQAMLGVSQRMRSPLVLDAVERYLRGERYPLHMNHALL